MKKIFSMFAFVAIMILGAVTLASCDKNDDNTSTGTKHSYTFRAEYSSDNLPKDSIDKVNEFYKKVMENDSKLKPITCTESEASILWYNIETQGNSEMQAMVDEQAKALKDRTLAFTIKMLQDGKDYKKKTWTPSPLLFL